MKILVLNAGSSSLKFKLFDYPGRKVLLEGIAEKIGEEESYIRINEMREQTRFNNHFEALKYLIESDDFSYSPEEITAVGHRVVHGGNTFVRPVVITQEVKKKIRELFVLAPLHNPSNLTGIETAEKLFPHAIQAAVFDTAFHASIPEYEHRYAIPTHFYEKGIRQYGFHGISHAYVSKKAREKLQSEENKIITLHLGNGASATAIQNGKSIATSMGFGPLPGLMMGTRPGDLDPTIILYLQETLGFSSDEIARILNKESGLKAITGYNDMRTIEKLYEDGNRKALLALEMYTRRIKKYIGAYMAILNGVDALVFTGGVGENSVLVRAWSLLDMEFAGIHLDLERNKNPHSFNGEIHHQQSKVKIYVIPTDEELEIAEQTYNLINS